MIELLRHWAHRAEGATAIEYSLIAALIGVAVWGMGGPAFRTIAQMYESLSTAVAGAG